MSKVDYITPVKAVHGRPDSKSKAYFTERWGRTYQSNYPLHKNVKKITTDQRAAQSDFTDAVAEAKRQLADPVLAAQWREKFNEQLAHPKAGQKRYVILRNFVIASLAHPEI